MSDIGQEDFSISLDDGKYIITYLVGGGFRWLRHGEPWPVAQDLTHSKVVVSLIFRVNELEVELHKKTMGDAPAIGARAAHYGDGVQPWDHIRTAGWGPEFAAGNALKYVRRYQNKNGEDDLAKGRWYYHELVQMVAEVAHYGEDRAAGERKALGSIVHAGRVLNTLEFMLTTEERSLMRAVPGA